MIADLANIPTDALLVLLGIAVAWGGVTMWLWGVNRKEGER